MQNRTVSDMSILTYDGIGIAVAVHDASILQIRTGFKDQAAIVTAK